MYSRAVLSSYLYLPTKEIGNVESLRRELTIRPKYEGEEVRLFSERDGWFGVPVFHYRVTQVEKMIDKRIKNPVSIGFRTKLWEKQERIISDFENHVLGKDTGFILESSPGTGKTVMAIKMISVLGQKTLVVVPRSNLIRQWRDRLLQHSNLKPSEIGWVEGGKGEWLKKKVVIGLVHSLVLDRFGGDFKRQFGCVVFDEVDRSVPPQTFAPAVAMFPAKYRIGLSATLKRVDGMEVVFYKHMGQVLLKGSNEGRMKPTVLVHHFPFSSGFIYPGSRKMNRRGMLISRLAENPLRNQLLGKYIKMIWKSGRKCLVLSDRKKQLVHLRQWLFHNGVPDREMGYYMRSLLGNKSMSEQERRRVASACSILLATYQMIALGTDIPDLAGLVYATPQSEVRQSQGRIERFLTGKKQPVVVDLVDVHYGDVIGWAVKRKRYYQSQGLEVKTI